MKFARALAIGASIATISSMAMFPAQAADEGATACNGTGDARTVDGLVVKAGEVCNLVGTTVNGSVKLEQNASLITEGATINGNVTVGKNAFLDARGGSINGFVKAEESFGTYLTESRVRGTVRATKGDAEPFFFAEKTHMHNNVTLEVSTGSLVETSVAGSLVAHDGEFFDLHNSSVFRGLTVARNSGGTVVCGTTVATFASIVGNGYVQIGKGDIGACDKKNYFGNMLAVSGNTGAVTLRDSHIASILTGYGNAETPVVGTSVHAGTVMGQFRGIKPVEPTPTFSPTPSEPAAEDRAAIDSQKTAKELIQAKRAERRAAALKAAAEAGSAF